MSTLLGSALMRISAALMTAALFSVGCARDESESHGAVELGAPFQCGEPIGQLMALPDDYSSIGDVVALPLEAIVHDFDRAQSGPDNDRSSRRRYIKVGLLVRANTNFEIHVAPSSQSNLLIHWGNVGSSDPVSSLSIRGCESEGAEWLAYPGGLWALDAGCVTLLVVVHGEAFERNVALGETCDS